MLNQGGDTSYTYLWSTTAQISSVDTSSPVAQILDDTTVFTVQVSGLNGTDTCISVQEINVFREPPVLIQVPKDTIVCTSIFFVDSYFENASKVEWSFSPSFSPIVITNVSDFYIGLPPAPFDLIMYVRAESPNGCIDYDTLRVLKRDIPINVDFQYAIDQCEDSLVLQFTNLTTIPNGLTLASGFGMYRMVHKQQHKICKLSNIVQTLLPSVYRSIQWRDVMPSKLILFL